MPPGSKTVKGEIKNWLGDCAPADLIEKCASSIEHEFTTTLQAAKREARIEAILGLHDSIMRSELELTAEPDQAFNYARVHHWLDKQAGATVDTTLVDSLKKTICHKHGWGDSCPAIRKRLYDLSHPNQPKEDQDAD